MADSPGGGCLKGCGCFLLAILLLVIITGITGLYYLGSGTVTAARPDRLRTITADICSCSIPDSFVPLFGIDFAFVRGALFMDAQNSVTNAFMLTMDTTMVKSLNEQYKTFAEKLFDNKKPKSRKTVSLEPIYFDITNRINRFVTYMVLQNNQKRIVYEAYFSYSNRLVLAACVARKTNYMDIGQAFIDSLGPPARTETEQRTLTRQ
jgi:hypothetical protein